MSTIASPFSSLPRARNFDNGAKFARSLGDVPMSRVIWNPLSGTVTEQRWLNLVEGGDKRHCELGDGALVEKPVGFEKSLTTLSIAYALKTFADPRTLGLASRSTWRSLGFLLTLADIFKISDFE